MPAFLVLNATICIPGYNDMEKHNRNFKKNTITYNITKEYNKSNIDVEYCLQIRLPNTRQLYRIVVCIASANEQ